MRVCMIIEGSYPYITGGVSSWVHEMITGLAEIEFSLLTLSPEAGMPLRYELPKNVVEHADLPLDRPPEDRRGEINSDTLVHGMLAQHERMFVNAEPDVEKLIADMPEGYPMHRDAVLNDAAWSFVGHANVRRNPLYPFSDYFWAWKSSHDLVFTVLAAHAPEADVYHSVSTGFAGLAALSAKLRKKKPFILTEHGLYHKEREIEIRKAKFVKGYQRDMWIRMYNRIANICYSKADMCTSLFEDNRRYQLELGASYEKTVVIPNGIDVARFSVERKPRPGGFHIGLVGRVVPIKDIKTFILTAKIALEYVPDAYFYVIGPDDEDKAYADECRRLVDNLKLGARFVFTGRANVLEYYAFLDLAMLTSIREAQPLVILEAWAAGVPVVATDVGNVSELLEGDTRFVAPTKDAARLAEGVRYVREHPEEIAALAEKNRIKVSALYEKKKLLGRYRDLYRRVAGGD